MSPTHSNDLYIQLLRRELWAREYGNAPLRAQKWTGKAISDKIEIAIGAELEAKNMGKGAPHPDTIVNFLNRKTHPSTRLLDTLAWYLRGDQENFVSFEAYKLLVTDEGQQLPTEIEAETADELPTEPASWWKRYRIPVLITILILLLLKACCPGKRGTQEFYQRFTTSNLDSLSQEGWFLHPHYIKLEDWDNPKYRDSSYLVLETHLGDHWLYNPDYEPKIPNILIRPVRCGDCCEIEVKIVNFNPYQRYQQAGIFFFGNEDIFTNVKFTLVGLERGPLWVQAGAKTAKYFHEEFFSINDPQYRPRLELSVYDTSKVAGKQDQYLTPIDSIILSIIFDGDQFFYKHRGRDTSYTVIGNSTTPFSHIRYIGLAAFQGRPDLPSPVYDVADTIPAYFEYVKLTKCR